MMIIYIINSYNIIASVIGQFWTFHYYGLPTKAQRTSI